MRRSLALLACVAFIACENETAKFHPGDIVADKLHPLGEAVVYLRLKPSVHQIYYLRLQRSPKEIAEGASKTYVDGPYDEDQLELVRRQ